MTDALWIVPDYPWGDVVLGWFYLTQVQALAVRGLEIVVASPTPWAPWPVSALRHQWHRYADAPKRATDDGITVLRPRYLGLPGEPRWAVPDRLIARAVLRDREAWDHARLIHGHSAVTGLAAWRLARLTGLPFIITFHGSDLNSWPDQHPEWVPDLRAAAREARAIITVSAALAARFKSITGVEAIHLPLGSDHRSLAALALPRDAARAALHLASDKIVVLFVGVLSAAKGVPELVDAIIANGDQFRGVFVGDGPKMGYGSDDPRGAGCVEYRGFRPHEEIVTYMSAADVLVLPSHNEGLPTVLVEAGSIGLPVIASAVGGIPTLLDGERGTILRDVSAEAISEALVDFARRRSEAKAAAARLREFVHAEHDVDVNVSRLLEVYGL
jgi:teichuronic acid biosynthesis glycosyltransferase TuaC